MRAAVITQPGARDLANEDWAGAAPDLAVVLDGVSAPGSTGTGCRHGTPWYVAKLGPRLLTLASDPDRTLVYALAEAIRQVADLHPECDLTHPGTPSATLVLLRTLGERADYLVLGDAVLLLDTSNGLQVVTDDRINHLATKERAAASRLPTGSASHVRRRMRLTTTLRRARNRPGGYWVAAADPLAATQAITGSLTRENLHRAVLLSDGASRLVDVFGLATWKELLTLLDESGPVELVRRVRAAEAADPQGRRWPRTKLSDDATAIYLVLDAEAV
jgi:serine/threonine protein phosphatase PrpC